jgi:hypothetical protein
MKKLLLPAACLLFSGSVFAQTPWMKDLKEPQKLSALVEAYNHDLIQRVLEDDVTNDYNAVIETKNYHFSRWLWYWERHTDENGYLVSPLKKVHEWRKFQISSAARNKTTADPANWTFQGPDKSAGGGNGVGRINVIAFHPTDTNIFWIGSAGGGAWKTTNHGVSWTAVNDHFPVLGVSDIDFNPTNPNTIYICTGDRDAGDTYSAGVLKSTDGGATWDTTGINLKPSSFILTNSLVINHLDTNSLTLGTSNGIMKSYDGGVTWTKVLTGDFKQIVYRPGDTSVIYAAGFTTSARQVFRSKDGGLNWNQVSNFPGNIRIAIAVTPANPNLLKVIVANTSYGLEGIYSSSDTGSTFTKLSDGGSNCQTNILANAPKGDKCGGQGWYDLSIAVSPIDSNFIVVGGVNTWYSTDGGVSWKISSQWASTLPGVKVVHADKHYHIFQPQRPTFLFECNDGGIYYSTNPAGQIWTDITNGLGITQFYRNAVSGNASFVLGGAQDNGTKRIENGVYKEQTGGDGMDCHIDQTDSRTYYTSQQYGELRRTINNGGNFSDISNNLPGGQQEGDWITPFAINPHEPNKLIAGYDRVYASDQYGDTWTAISPSVGTKLKRLEFSPRNPNYIYAMTTGIVRMTTDYGATWKSIPASLGTLTDIKPDPWDETHFWVTFGGYGTNKVAEYSVTDGWKTRNEGLPDIPVNCLVIDYQDGTRYIGTDFGIFYRPYSAVEWMSYNKGLPAVEVIDLGINNTTGEIWASTYGRGMWKSPTISFPTKISTVPFASDALIIAPNPNKGQFQIAIKNGIGNSETLTLRIMDINGTLVLNKVVYSDASGKINIDVTLPRGTYMTEIFKNGVTFGKAKMITY